MQPGSAEMPSAGRPFTPELVTALVARAIAVVPLTLHAGVSSHEAGEAPYPERYGVRPAALAEGYLWHEFGDVHLILPV